MKETQLLRGDFLTTATFMQYQDGQTAKRVVIGAMATQSIPAGYKLVPDDGGIETPMAGGKAEAMAAFLASGGATRGSGRSGRNGTYTKGALKGKTIEEAKQMFEQRWSTASPEIKDKYAARTGEAALAPSEKARMAGNIRPTPTNESLNAALPGETATQMYARQRAERMGKPPAAVTAPAKKPAAWDKDGNGVPDSIQRPASTSATTTAAARGQATPDENARAQAMLNDALGSDKYATADNGGGSMRPANQINDRQRGFRHSGADGSGNSPGNQCPKAG
ncbi:MAG: hypothetical protein CFE26_16480 [Verrucomicrobiales bacterium VVV1]|nr:MAG: hypothetical protein CFE26_16480 [Verrucomicrobiales bacterium VVV1]